MKDVEIFIDGLNVFLRHYAANPSVSLHNKQCGAIFGMLNNIEYLCRKYTPSKLTVVWEGGGSSRRRIIDGSYKKGRRPLKLNRPQFYENEIFEDNDSINEQMTLLISILYKTPVTQLYVDDCEADDIIGYICKNKKKYTNAIIVSSDKDYYQLVNDQITIWSPNRKILIDESFIYETYGLYPVNFCTARCFSGDKSDNIEGIKSIGIKKLLNNFDDFNKCKFISVDDIIQISEKIVSNTKKPKTIFKNIIENKIIPTKNWKLMYLDSSMLSYNQIKQINEQYDLIKNKCDKFNLLRQMIKNGLNNFDANNFIHTIDLYLKENK